MTHTQLSIRVVGLVHLYIIPEGDVVAPTWCRSWDAPKGRRSTWPLWHG